MKILVSNSAIEEKLAGSDVSLYQNLICMDVYLCVVKKDGDVRVFLVDKSKQDLKAGALSFPHEQYWKDVSSLIQKNMQYVDILTIVSNKYND